MNASVHRANRPMILFFKNALELHFKSGDGERAFFPYGRFSRGRVVDPDREAALRRFLRRWYGGSEILIIAQILLQAFIGFERTLYFIALELVLMLAVYRLALRSLLKNCPVSRIRISSSDIRLKQAQALSAGRIWFLVLTSILMTLVSAFAFWLSLRAPDWHTAASGLGILLFGASLIVALRLVRLRRTGEGSN